MEDIARGVLAGIAFGGFVASVVTANQLAVQALWRLNCLVAKITVFTIEAVGEKIERKRLAENEYDLADEDEDED